MSYFQPQGRTMNYSTCCHKCVFKSKTAFLDKKLLYIILKVSEIFVHCRVKKIGESAAVSDLSFSDDEDADINIIGDPPLYKDAAITLNDSMTAILSYIIRHELSGKEIVDLLNLINLHCPQEKNQMITSLYFFKKYFSLLESPVKCHYYCSSCYSKLVNEGDSCPNQKVHPSSTGTSVFVELPLIPQLQALFSQTEFCSNLGYSYKRKKTFPNNLEDIFDGQLYKELVQSGFLGPQHPYNFSMISNSDGVPVFHSTNQSLWPLYFNILELPPHLRFKKEFTWIPGLWFGSKPVVNLILSPLLPTMNKIKNGFKVNPCGNNGEETAKGIFLAATTDLPAKVMLLGMASFSGAFGCQICKIKGDSIKIEKRKGKKDYTDSKTSSVWVYKYSENLDLRSHQETVQFGIDAQREMISGKTKVNIFGVKFPSAMFKIMYDGIRGFGVDDLHTFYLGVIKHLISFWFDAKSHYEPFSIRKYVGTVDKRLKVVKLPNFIESATSSIENNLAHWKGKDFLNWAHYISIPILDDILPDKYLEHYVDLINCLQLLQSSSIPPSDLLACDKVLKNYVKQFENLYGTRHMSMVFHLLQHLVFVVNNLGPFKNLSCFPYESLNGDILKMIHGTRYVETQLASGCFLIRKLPRRLENLQEEKVKNFCERMLHPSKRLKILEVIDSEVLSVGTYQEIKNDDIPETTCLKNFLHSHKKPVLKSFKKLKQKHLLFVARSYKRCVRTNSFTCSFMFKGKKMYGAIEVFVKATLATETNFYAVIEIADVVPYYAGNKLVRHIQRYNLLKEFVAVPVTDLKDVMVFIQVETKSYICEPLDHALKS
ncbi:Peroxisome biogenesis protein 19-1 [Frankliniella fusca]|uniref:Peroxisome biogenesis protein 19-1 n=1 Tax=Frankliniella fusca TaxID=407009 RepID=A0AAE1HY90_9NEOP|nr:Peroxisome biogenesis protein 19-1 [Frankliniella fusca]